MQYLKLILAIFLILFTVGFFGLISWPFIATLSKYFFQLFSG